MPKYPYIVLPGKIRPVYKPLIKITLHYQKTDKITLPITTLIDSGADSCFCLKNIGIWLGIKFDKKRTEIFTTADKTKFKAIKENVVLKACGKNYRCPFFFTDVLPRQTPIILGQFGFFDHFKIAFDAKNKSIEIV